MHALFAGQKHSMKGVVAQDDAVWSRRMLQGLPFEALLMHRQRESPLAVVTTTCPSKNQKISVICRSVLTLCIFLPPHLLACQPFHCHVC